MPKPTCSTTKTGRIYPQDLESSRHLFRSNSSSICRRIICHTRCSQTLTDSRRTRSSSKCTHTTNSNSNNGSLRISLQRAYSRQTRALDLPFLAL